MCRWVLIAGLSLMAFDCLGPLDTSASAASREGYSTQRLPPAVTAPQNGETWRIAQASCAVCGQRSRSCHAPCKRMNAGPRKGACHSSCRSKLARCKAHCRKSAKGKKRKRAKAKPVNLSAQVRPRVSGRGARKLAIETRKSLVAALPPSIDDITAILDKQKLTDQNAAEKKRRLADAKAPKTKSKSRLAKFYAERGLAAGEIGRSQQAIDDLKKAVALAKRSNAELYKESLWDLASAQLRSGRIAEGMRNYEASLKVRMPNGQRLTRSAVVALARAQSGDIAGGERLMKTVESLLARASGFKASVRRKFWNVWLGRSKRAKGDIAFLKGNYALAESMYRDALYLVEKDLKRGADQKWGGYVRELCRMQLSSTLVRLGRMVEAETVVRKSLIDTLARVGRYSTETPRVLLRFAKVVAAQGRYAEAEELLAASIKTMQKMSFPNDSSRMVRANMAIASARFLSGDLKGALGIFESIEAVLETSKDELVRDFFDANRDWLLALSLTGQHDKALPKIRAALKAAGKAKAREVAVERGILAVALAKAGDLEAAHRAFQQSVPILLSGAQANEDEEYTLGTAREHRVRLILEAYLAHLANLSGTPLEKALGINAAEAGFQVADSARGQLVQRAVSAASARASVKEKKLADLIRAEQDARKRLTAQTGLLAGILSKPSDQQDTKAVTALRANTAKLRKGLEGINREIRKKFPGYADLLNPKAPKSAEVQAALGPDEAFVSIYLGRDRSYVWAVPKSGDVVFHASDLTQAKAAKYVEALRDALNPQAATLGDIPDFDVRIAYRLYTKILKPVEAGWRQAKSLLVSTNGALGQLPLSLLPTEKSRVETENGSLFAGYRNIKWLARSHAITLLPSVSTLMTLRSVPKGAKDRRPFIGFGNPVFKETRTKVAEAPTKAVGALAARGVLRTRGMPIRLRAAPKADEMKMPDLSSLPHLPDTGEEVRSIAIAMQADPSTAVKLGVKANEDTIGKEDLRKYRVIAFATHGLIPGDLAGLREPALALSAPGLAKSGGDGLLTMSEIMGLKLDADWVVLSACNTGSGRGAGAEAVSGLGRAFFYAGTRALLVSSWPVETTSARLLTTDVFDRLTKDQSLSRAVALQEAVSALIDKPGQTDAETNAPLFYYAHPIFWAPFILVGDGGGAA